MDIKKGDKVRFLNTTGGGVVTKTEGRLAFVDDEDGFEVPVLMSELVLVEQNIEINTPGISSGNAPEKQPEQEKEESYEYEEDDDGDDDPRFYLSFLKGDAPGVESGSVRTFIINDSNYFCYYLVNETGINDKTINLHEGRIEPNTKYELGKYLITELDGVKWDIQVLLYKQNKPFEPVPPQSSGFQLKGSKLMNDNNYKDNDYFDEKAYMLTVLKGKLERQMEKLTEKEIEKVKKDKSKQEPGKKAKRRDEPGLLEVDLHIHELIDDTRGLSNSEMLEIQMNKFHQVMKENMKNKKRKIVFIHGVGNGTLKTELRKALDRKYKGKYYQDASFREYGYGATMVII